MSKDSFRDALRKWVQETLTQATTTDAFRIQQKTVWIHDASQEQPGRYRQDLDTDVQWSGDFIDKAHNSALCANVELEAATWPALATHVASHFGSALSRGTLYSELKFITAAFLQRPVFDKTNSRILTNFETDKFERDFSDFSRFVEGETVTYYHTALLLGLRMPDSTLPLTLAQDVIIDRLTPDQLQYFGDRGLIQAPWGNLGPYEVHFQPILALHWKRTFSKLTRDDAGTAQQGHAEAIAFAETEFVHEAILAAFALTAFGVVSLGATTTTQISWGIGDVRSTYGAESSGLLMENRTMTLTADDSSSVRELFTAILTRRSLNDKLGIAVRRLTFAMENKRDEDRLLDGIMAAEALMGEQTEIAFKISLRAAFYLQKNDPEARRIVFDDMNRAYTVRSKLVHGSKIAAKHLKISGSDVGLPDFVRSIETYLRKIVCQLLIDGAIPDWNDYIIGPKARNSTAALEQPSGTD